MATTWRSIGMVASLLASGCREAHSASASEDASFGVADAAMVVDASSQPPTLGPTITLSLDRVQRSATITATVAVTGDDGGLAAGSAPTLAVTSGSATALAPTAPGVFTSTVTPAALDSEVPITATWQGLSVTKTALVFTTNDDSLGQAVAVDGLVNTPGWEDGEDISPDGQWLIVASYVPIDLISCVVANVSPSGPACKTIIGPYAAPARPGMLGASRIANGTYTNTCPDLGLTMPSTTTSFFPTAAFGFHRQPDGSFAEPFVIGYDADGCLGPYGHTFTGPPSGKSAAIVFAEQNPNQPDDVAHIHYAPLTLGQPNILGKYRIVNGALTELDAIDVVVAPVTAARQGNPFYGGGRLWWDDESLPTNEQILSFADETGTLPAVAAGDAGVVAVGTSGTQKIQPSLDGQTLYWMGGGVVYASTLASGGDPASASSWSAAKSMLGPASQAGPAIVATGEPNVAHLGTGSSELYFVYIKKTSTGYDCNIGRVPFR